MEVADVKLINTDGMAFIGPGSEWFWTAVSGLVLAATFLAIYRQLRIARSANAFAQLGEIQREGDSERMTRYKLDVLLARRSGADPAAMPAAAASTVSDFWERVALLVRTGHVDRNLFYEQAGLSCQRWWAVLGPFIIATRISGHPKIGQNFEWLAGIFASSMRRVGKQVVFDEAFFKANIDGMIVGCRDDIRVWEALRTTISAPQEVGPAAKPEVDVSPTPAPDLPADVASAAATG
jgi:hypothetical protein